MCVCVCVCVCSVCVFYHVVPAGTPRGVPVPRLKENDALETDFGATKVFCARRASRECGKQARGAGRLAGKRVPSIRCAWSSSSQFPRVNACEAIHLKKEKNTCESRFSPGPVVDKSHTLYGPYKRAQEARRATLSFVPMRVGSRFRWTFLPFPSKSHRQSGSMSLLRVHASIRVKIDPPFSAGASISPFRSVPFWRFRQRLGLLASRPSERSKARGRGAKHTRSKLAAAPLVVCPPACARASIRHTSERLCV